MKNTSEYLNQLFGLSGKVVVLTGGMGKLGTEFATSLSVAGAQVVRFDVASGAEFQIDITNREQVASAVAEVAKKFGRIDALINNAAINPVPGTAESAVQFSAYEDYPPELWEKEIAVGLTGALYCAQAVAPIMKQQGTGSIINISSTYGNVGPDNRIYEAGQFKSIGYATVKGALLNFTRAWATYLAGTGIRVNTLTMGGVEAGQDPDFVRKYSARTILGRMADKSDYNGAIIFLVSDASRYMTGANLIIDGGWTAW
ncbi:hypothetical protein A2671_00180 [Candidatus Kaiserbacteria bacterium RIFCSPHIGHO2_01_FULL_49_13]|uniref:Short-chain dehydrogenase n=1 Tax=Candidatus Kaiserbacteria bacterium RIFCSPHIGHO2_01_FULL_49_13 TaxID=1798477 RepID=A0A1F6CDE6_9BACT|nr:MAG: hypothetical protein A2671_00180 [Candidatus Kaiserbacteria bacterium RIFCSPHIGHO2_01_FULL_49_13]